MKILIMSFQYKPMFFLIFLVFLSSKLLANSYYQQIRKEYESLLDKKYVLLPHRGNFLLPVVYNDNPNNGVFNGSAIQTQIQERGEIVKPAEAEFQLSFTLLTDKNFFGSGLGLFIGYTQKSYWQVYNSEWSKPFRESNYAPEVFLRKIFDKPKDVFGMKLVVVDIGLIHQSNGQIQELSRSWDRIYFRTAFLKNRFSLIADIWYRFPERESEDENKSIYKYVGYGELMLRYNTGNNYYQLTILPGTERQGVEFSYSYPINDAIRFFTKISHGYGLSLQDFDHENRKIGIGFSLGDPFTNNPDTARDSWFF